MRNVKAARARRGIEQETLAARMRALGFLVWVRQTVARIESGKRRLTAEEVFGLAIALEVSVMHLMEPVRDDGLVVLPSGAELQFGTVHELFWGGTDYGVKWDGDVPRVPADGPPRGWTLNYPETEIPPPRIRRGGVEASRPEPAEPSAEAFRPRVKWSDEDEQGDDQ
jgi:transcriptional regulator with XRE-family HTH domain